MIYAAIVTELARPAMAGLSDAAVVAALEAEQVEQDRVASGAELRDLLLRSRELGRVILLSRQAVPLDDALAPAVVAAINVVEAIRADSLPPGDALWQALAEDLLVLQSAAGVAKGTADDFVALRKRSVSRLEAIGLAGLRPGDVATARATLGDPREAGRGMAR
ncbi:MAG: hypothetical protein K2X74_00450 [Acetobacteraceae bacterium]|nr:hypothetical protein [Acetobacteraceae bacterium]